MMKAKLSNLALFLTVSMVFTIPLFAQAPDTLWTRTYGDSGVSVARGVAQLPGGGFMVGGYTPDMGGQRDVWLFRVDADGNMLWEDKIGGADTPEEAYTLEPALDGQFVLTGLGVNELGRGKAYIIKADSAGSGWGFLHGDRMENTYAYHAVATTYHGVVAVGYQTVELAGANAYVVATGPTGLFMWDRIYNWGWTDIARGVTRTEDGGYMVVGETNSFGLHTTGIFLQKLDSLGLDDGFILITWEGDQCGNCVQQTLDGGYIIVGSEWDPDYPNYDMLIIKTDSHGMMEWHKVYGGDRHEVATYVHTLADSGYVVTGVGCEPGAMDSDVWVLRLDANGDTLWTKFIGAGWVSESSYQIRPTSDGGYIIAGARGVGPLHTLAYLIRLGPDPVGIGSDEYDFVRNDSILLQNYPNPFHRGTSISYGVAESSRVTLEIYDVAGRVVHTLVNGDLEPGRYAAYWDGKDRSGHDAGTGVYFYRLTAGDFTSAKKMLLLR